MKHKLLSFISSGVFAGAVLLVPHFASAITVSPLVIEADADPGQQVTRVLRVFNESAAPIELFMEKVAFTARDDAEEGGKPQFIPPDQTSEQLLNWISFSTDSVGLQPQQDSEVLLTIKVPQDAEAGGHYAAVFWSSDPPSEAGGGSQIKIGSKVATLILLNVSGNVIENASLSLFSTINNKQFFNRLPVDFDLRFVNNGTVHVKPQGSLEISDMLGRKSKIVLVNDAGGNVLPGTARKYQSFWTKKPTVDAEGYPLDEALYRPPKAGFFKELKNEANNFALGKYKADVTLAYGRKQDKVITSHTSFWVFPWRFLLVTILVLVLLIFFVHWNIKRYNKWIIEQARKSGKV